MGPIEEEDEDGEGEKYGVGEGEEYDNVMGSPARTTSPLRQNINPSSCSLAHLPDQRINRPSPLRQTWGPSDSLTPLHVDEDNTNLSPSSLSSFLLSLLHGEVPVTTSASGDFLDHPPLTITIPARSRQNMGDLPEPNPPEAQTGRIRAAAKKKKPSCPRGGKSLRVQRVAGQRVTAKERQRLSRMGPEGMGDTNDCDDAAAYVEDDGAAADQEDDDEQQHDVPSSVEHLTSSTQALPQGYIMYNDGQGRPEIQVLKERARWFLTTLASGCRECLPGSTKGTTMVANPIDVFRALNNGFLPGTLNQLTKATGGSVAHQAHLCADAFTPDEGAADSEQPEAKSSVLATLTAVASNVINAEILEAIAQVIYWINAIHFAASIMR